VRIPTQAATLPNPPSHASARDGYARLADKLICNPRLDLAKSLVKHELGTWEAVAHSDNIDLYDDWDEDWTLVHYAAAAGAVEVLRALLLERKLFSVDDAPGRSCTPLRAAVSNSRLPRPEYRDACTAAVRLLLQHGADDTIAREADPTDMPLPAAVAASVQAWFPLRADLRDVAAHPERLPPASTDFDPTVPWQVTPLVALVATEGRLLDATCRCNALSSRLRDCLLTRWEEDVRNSEGAAASVEPTVGEDARKLQAALGRLTAVWPAAAVTVHAYAHALLSQRREHRGWLRLEAAEHAAVARGEPIVKGAAGAGGWEAVMGVVVMGSGGSAWRRRRAAVCEWGPL